MRSLRSSNKPAQAGNPPEKQSAPQSKRAVHDERAPALRASCSSGFHSLCAIRLARNHAARSLFAPIGSRSAPQSHGWTPAGSAWGAFGTGGRIWSGGRHAFRRALAAGEQKEAVWLNLAAATAAVGNRALALADLRLGMQALPVNAPGLLKAQTQVQALKPSDSPLLVARAICPQGPYPLLSLYTRGSFFNKPVENWGRKHPEESGFATRANWVAATPNDAETQRLWGLALIRNRRLPEAGAALERSVTLAPHSAPTLLALADWLDASGESTRATVVYFDCLKLKPNWLPALLGVGKTSLDTGINGYALSSYEKATALYPKSVEAWIGLGRAYRKTSVDAAKAIAAFQTVERLAPDRTDYYDDYADALRKNVQWPAAEALVRKRLKAANDDAFAHYLLGMVLLNNAPTPERQTEAEAETREALRLYPHNPLADLQLAQMLLSKKQIPEAIALLNDALQHNPYNRNAMSVLARAYRQAGRTDLAEKVSKRAEDLYKDQQRLQVLEGQEAKQLMDVHIHEELAQGCTDEPARRRKQVMSRAWPNSSMTTLKKRQRNWKNSVPCAMKPFQQNRFRVCSSVFLASLILSGFVTGCRPGNATLVNRLYCTSSAPCRSIHSAVYRRCPIRRHPLPLEDRRQAPAQHPANHRQRLRVSGLRQRRQLGYSAHRPQTRAVSRRRQRPLYRCYG